MNPRATFTVPSDMDDSARAFRTLSSLLGGGFLALLLTTGVTARQAGGSGEEGAGAALGARATALLEAEDPLDQARGAWLVGAHQLVDQVPRIHGLLVEEAGRSQAPTPEETRLRLGLLDALLQLGAALPVELAEEAWKLNRLLTLALISREATKHQVFLEGLLGERLQDTLWVAVRNLLLRGRSPRLAHALLDGRTEVHLLKVFEPTNLSLSGACGGAHSCGRGSFQRRGFPGLPSVAFRATFTTTPGAVVLAPGRRPVYYVRRVYPADGIFGGGGGSSHTSLDRESATLDYLREMAPARLTSFLGGRSHFIEWSDLATFRGEAREKLREVRGQREQFLEHLRAQGWLDRRLPLAGFPKLAFRLVDERVDRSVALGNLDELD